MSIFAETMVELNAMKGSQTVEATARFAAHERDAVITAEHPSSVMTFVDGRPDASLDSVSPTGTIVFRFSYAQEIAQAIYDQLVQMSPYSNKRANANPPTHYRDEHVIMVNGAVTDVLPDSLAQDDLVVFVNVQPYARKIERGFSVQAPNGVYEMVAGLMRGRYGNAASIEFSYVEMPGACSIARERKAILTKSQRSADDRFPAITVRNIAP